MSGGITMVKSKLHMSIKFVVIFIFSYCIFSCKCTAYSNILSTKGLPVSEDSSGSLDSIEFEQAMKNIKINNAVKSNSAKEFSICFAGDTAMDSFIYDYIKRYGETYPFDDASNILKSADISVVNLETSVSYRGSTRKPSGYGFRSAPTTLEGLKKTGIDLVSLANNHVMDFGQDAFYDTLKRLKDYGLYYTGAGENLSSARKGTIMEINGFKIAFLSYTSIIPWSGWCASENTPGPAPLINHDCTEIIKDIQRIKDTCSIIVVILHWGTEYDTSPATWQIELAHKLIDNGADVIAGHHPHVLQGVEIYNGKPILYSTGNFVFFKKDENCARTGIFKLYFENNKFKEGCFYPAYIKNCQADILDSGNGKGKEIVELLSKLSSPFGTKIQSSGRILPDSH
jgi:Putative enzyme of poly-gamma-glutamate biosynthesis (capsule formation)